uniref:Uncharacterized protein n=1 Tax=Kalanchoe fedtschenkoi TaxID=63787 RepID=A0A7N1A451_KALFE
MLVRRILRSSLLNTRRAILRRQLSTTSKLPKSLYKFSRDRPRVILEAQKALTDYLHTTRLLPFVYAEQIAINSTFSLSETVSKIDFTPATFCRKFHRFLNYHPVNELQFFYESIGISYSDLGSVLPADKFFITEEFGEFDVACLLFRFGFPWNRLARLYEAQVNIFKMDLKVLSDRLLYFKSEFGFDSAMIVGMCIVFPLLLSGGSEKGSDVELMLDDLKWVFGCFDSGNCEMTDENVWIDTCRKIKVFYDMGCEKGRVESILRRCRDLFRVYSEEELSQKMAYFCRLGVDKMDVVMLIIKCPEIMDFDLQTRDFSVLGFLKHFGMSENEMDSIALKYPYVIGRNKIANLPHVMRALDLQNWFFEKLKNGNHMRMRSYELPDGSEGDNKAYKDGYEKIQFVSRPAFTLSKLEFLHGIGFGENKITIDLLPAVRGTSTELQDRFNCLIDLGAEFSKICKAVVQVPKILNQNPNITIQKVNFLLDEIGLSISYLYRFPAYLSFDLDYRIKPRYRFHEWLEEKGVSSTRYSLSTLISTGEAKYIAYVYRIQPAAPKHYLECFFFRKPSRVS